MGFPSSPSSAWPVTVDVDFARKILRIRFCGQVRPEHVQTHLADAPRHLAQLGTGFTLITDLSGLDQMDLDCAPPLTRFMDLCRSGGLARVVRIIPNPRKDIGFNVLSQVHYRGKIPIVICQTEAEAQQELGDG